MILGKWFREWRDAKQGVASLMVAASLVGVMGFAAISVDAGRVYTVWTTLQDTTRAAALAGAKDIGVDGGTPLVTAAAYGSAATSRNVISGVTTTMVPGYPKLVCFAGSAKSGLACNTNQTPSTAANGIQVEQTATIPLYFSRVLGLKTVTLSAGAVALGAGSNPPPMNVVFIVDATASMGDEDSACGQTKIKCAIKGFETLLGELWPCPSNLSSCGTATNGNVANAVDEAALLQFPGVQKAPTGAACPNLPTVPYAGIEGTTSKTTVAPSKTLNFASTPPFNTGSTALITDITHPSYIPAGTYLAADSSSTTATMSAAPTTKDTIGKGDKIAVWPPIYQIIPLSSDYRASDTATSLNTKSNLVGCLESLTPPGGFSTFYADAITVGQEILANAQVSRPTARNVLILLSDGEANATGTNMVSQGSKTLASSSNECKAAVTASQNAAKAGTWVYTVSYGTQSSGGCTTDTGQYANACWVMAQMANLPGATLGTSINDQTKFYADAGDGCSSPSHPSMTALSAIFQNIGYSLTAPRLLPNACIVGNPPSWC